MAVYRQLHAEVEAVQLTWGTWNELCDLIGDFPDGMRGVYIDDQGRPTDDFPGDRSATEMCPLGLLIPTAAGATVLAVQDDWIVRVAAGQVFRCPPDIFAALFDAVDPADNDGHQPGS